MDQIKRFIADCFKLLRECKNERLLTVASAGLDLISNELLSKSQPISNAYHVLQKSKATFYVFLVVGYMKHDERDKNLNVISCFSMALNADHRTTVKLLSKHVGVDFPMKIYRFILEKCFYHCDCADGMLSLLGILDPSSPFFHKPFPHHQKVLLGLICVWYDLLQRKSACSLIFVDTERFIKAVKSIEFKDLKFAISKWSSHGMKEFYNFDSKEALVSLLLAEDLHLLVDYEKKSQTHITLHIAACLYQLAEYEMAEQHLNHIPFEHEEVNELLSKWYKKAKTLGAQRQLKLSLFFYNAVLAITSITDKAKARATHTEMAKLLLKCGQYSDVQMHIQAAHKKFPRKDQNICASWNAIALVLGENKKLKESLAVYKLAFEVAPDHAIAVQRNIASKLSSLAAKCHEFTEALNYARKCIELAPLWDEGYYLLGTAQVNLKLYTESIESFLNGFVQASYEDKSSYVIAILKARLHNNSKDRLPSDLHHKYVVEALENLKTKDRKLYWTVLKNILGSQAFNTSVVSIGCALADKLSEDFIISIIKNGALAHSKEFEYVDAAFSKKFFKMCAFIFKYGFDATESPRVISCLNFAIEKDHPKVFMEFLNLEKISSRNVSLKDSSGNTALHICCQGRFTETKLKLTELLINAGTDEDLRNREGEKAYECLEEGDERLVLFKERNQKVSLPKDIKLLKNMALHHFSRNDWDTAFNLFKLVFNQIKHKKKYMDESCEVLAYASLSLLFLGEMIPGVSLLIQAEETNRCKVRTLLTKLFGEDYYYTLVSFALKCFTNPFINAGHDLVAVSLKLVEFENHGEFLILLNCFSELNDYLFFPFQLRSPFFSMDFNMDNISSVFFKDLTDKLVEFGFESALPNGYITFNLIVKIFGSIDCPENARRNYAIAIAHKALQLHSSGSEGWAKLASKAQSTWSKVTEVLKDKYLDHSIVLKVFGNIEKSRDLVKIYLQFSQIFEVGGASLRSAHTHLSCCFAEFKFNQSFEDEAFKHISAAYECCQEINMEISKQWHTCAKTLKDTLNSFRVNKWALKVSPEDADHRATIKAEMSTLMMKMKNYEAASKLAKQCINLRKDWPQGYFRLGTSFSKLENWVQSLEIFQKGLTYVTEDLLQSSFLLEMVKVKFKLGSKDIVNIAVSSSAFNATISHLVKEGTSESWLYLQCLLMYFNKPKGVTLDNIPLKPAFKLDFEESFIEFLLENIDFNDQECFSLVDMAIDKNWLNVCAQLITRKCHNSRRKESALLLATKKTVQSGKIDLLKNVLTIIDEDPNEHGTRPIMSAILYCCEGPSSTIKVDIIKNILFVFTKHSFEVDMIAILKKISDKDPRWQALSNDNLDDHCAEENVRDESVEQQSAVIDDGHAPSKKKKKNKKKLRSGSEDNTRMKTNVITATILKTSEINDVKHILQDAVKDESKDVYQLLQSIDLSTLQEEDVVLQVPEHKEPRNDNEDSNFEEKVSYEIQDSSSESESESENVEIVGSIETEEFSFDGLPWEVECTQDVWHVLKDPKLNPVTKTKIVRKIKMLASGHWRRELAKPLEGVKGIKLYEAKINKGSRILWENAISFSARCSMDPTQLAVMNIDDTEKGAVYVDKIRVWSIALQHDEVRAMIENIESSHQRGQSCFIRKSLKGIRQEPMQIKREKLPNFYINETYTKEFMRRMASAKIEERVTDRYLFFPPASPNKQEYHILKFYAFSSAMASRILTLTHSHYDFPFQVSELEHSVIHLEPKNKCSILLLGRSGTGKTTCCLYRLWAHFQNYWEAASHAGPHLPKLKFPIIDDLEMLDNDKNTLYDTCSSDLRLKQPEKSDEDSENYVPCLCDGPCNCELLVATEEDMYASISNIKKEEEPCEEKGEQVNKDLDDTASATVEEYEHLRQILVTKNEVLCNEIRKNFNELRFGGVDISSQDDSNERITRIQDMTAVMYPLFTTTKDLLLLLDASLAGEMFFERDDGGEMVQNIRGWGKNKTHLSYLPLLHDELEPAESVADTVDKEETKIKEKEIADRTKGEVTRTKIEVTYDVFVGEIWPRISKGKYIDIHPSLVWMEIKSFIKGCAESFLSETGYLTKDSYVKIGRKRAPHFTGNREEIYMFFEKYCRIKATLGYFDEMDVHFNIYKRLKTSVIPDWGFHQIYVDETQDFTQAELLLLMKCSLNPNALFFTGDTAQSIMNGVAFRFCDLRSLFVIARNEFEKNKMLSPVVVPKRIHQLTHNYRSHSGILRLASVIVRLLKNLFPESFDHLKSDVGLFSGPKPVILDTNDFSELAMLLQGSRRETSSIEFGAHQVVLVQNEESKDSLPPELTYGLVLSIYEAKGLEFDDVLLYNFFKDSQAVDEWRVVTNHVNDLKDEEASESSLTVLTVSEDVLECESRPLDFNRNKHKLLNGELKRLYTAITRARVNVWIFDEDKKKRAPMFELFQKKNLVSVARLDQSAPGERQSLFAEKSSPQEWDKQGWQFYSKGLWKLAVKCAEKSGNKKLKDSCLAHIQAAHALEVAEKWKVKRSKKELEDVHREFRKAGYMFLECLMVEEAEICLKNCKDWKNLALLYEKQEKFALAGTYYRKCVDADDDALRCFELGGDFRSSVSLLKVRKRYLECLNILEHLGGSQSTFMTNMTKIDIAKTACEEFYESKDFESLEAALKYLEYNDQLEFLCDKDDCEKQLLRLYSDHKKQEELVAHLIRKERYLEAAGECLQMTPKAKCLLSAAKHMVLTDKRDEFKRLVVELKDVMYRLDNVAVKADCMYILMYLRRDTKYMNDALSIYDKCCNNIGKLFCLRHWLKTQPSFLLHFIYGLKSHALSALVGVIQTILSLLKDMLTPALFTNAIRNCFQFFGFAAQKDNLGLYILEDQLTLKFYQHHCSNISIKEATVDLLSSESVHDFIVSLIHDVLKEFTIDYRQRLWETVETYIVCPTMTCVKEDNCLKLHAIPTAESFKKGRQIVVALLRLCRVLIDGTTKLGNHYAPIIFGDFGWMKEEASEKLIEAMYDFVNSYMPYLHIIKGTVVSNFIEENDQLAEYGLVSCIRNTWSSRKVMDVNTYCKLSILSFLANRGNPVTDELLENSAESREIKWKYPYQVLKPFNDYLISLYYSYDVLRSLPAALCMLSVPLKETSLVKPTLTTFCDLIEMPVIATLCSLTASCNGVIQIPGSMKEKIDFHDIMYSKPNDTGFNKSLSRTSKSHIGRLAKFLDSFIELIIPTERLNNTAIVTLWQQLKRAEATSSELEERDAAERLIIILLWVMGHSESTVALRIKSYVLNKPFLGKHPLSKLYTSIGHLANKTSVFVLLTEILQKRNDKLVTYKWSSKHARFTENLMNASRQTQNEDSNKIKAILQRPAVGKAPVPVESRADEVDEFQFASEWDQMAQKADTEIVNREDVNGDEEKYAGQEISKREENIQRNIAATKISRWWKDTYGRLECKLRIIKYQKTYCAKRIQKWWRSRRKVCNIRQPPRVSNQTLPAETAKNFDGNRCIVCSNFVEDVQSHLESDEHVMKSSFESMLKKLVSNLEALYDNNASTTEGRKRFEEMVSGFSVSYTIAISGKRWSDRSMLHNTYNALMKDITQALQDGVEHDAEDDFILVTSKKPKWKH